MKRLLVIVLSFLFTSSHSSGQGHVIDSLKGVLKTSGEDSNKVQLLNEIGWRLTIKDIPEGKDYALKAKALGETLHFKKGIVRACNTLGVIEMDKGNYKESLDHFQLSLLLSNEIYYPIG
jgi:hypothetical protein